MVQRFYFDLKEGFSFIRDHEGVEARDLDQAVEEARMVIREMLGNEELSVEEAGWLLVIRDAAGETLITMPLVESGQVLSAAKLPTWMASTVLGFLVRTVAYM